ncbi:MAG: hypothetical protein LLG01_00785 [Planctomycetaceae bacterium]|nr:hypothetical protein [Planctomycetaceae bacterium]
MTDTTYTIAALTCDEQAQQNYPLIRQLAGEVLQPGPWEHDFAPKPGQDPFGFRHTGIGAIHICDKCHSEMGLTDDDTTYMQRDVGSGDIRVSSKNDKCPIPDPAIGSIADIASALVKRCLETEEGTGALGVAIGEVLVPMVSTTWRAQHFLAWLKATDPERAACCLVALGKAKVGE